MSYLLGIDIGTSSTKSLLYDVEAGRVVAVAGADYAIDQPQPGHAEQDPQTYWQATITTCRRILTGIDKQRVMAIGITGQMHGTVLLDKYDRVLHPAIIWADQRSASAVPQMVEQVGAERYAAIAGTLPAAGFMGATLYWLRQHRPALLDQAAKVILPKDAVRLQLTGEVATDISDAASTGLLDVQEGCWSDALLSTFDLPADLFPTVLPSHTQAGQLTADAANALGLNPGITVAAGCADQPAQAITNNVISPGRAAVTIGTGGQVFVPVQAGEGGTLPTDPRLHTFNHAAPATWYHLGAMLAAGLALRWLRNIVGLDSSASAYATLSAEAQQVGPGAGGLIFLPYLMGERTPHMDAHARGAFVGLGLHHQRSHLARAVMEGVALALRQVLTIALAHQPPPEMLIGAGGSMNSSVWPQIVADVLDVPLRPSQQPEQTALGAAVLAGVSIGIWPDVASGAATVARYGDPVLPVSSHRARYDRLYEQFTALYPTLKEDFHRLSSSHAVD